MKSLSNIKNVENIQKELLSIYNQLEEIHEKKREKELKL